MRFQDTLSLARDNLSRARLRTTLTAIGVAIGTAAVVTLISVGTGSENILVGQAAGLGQVTEIGVTPSTPATRNHNMRKQGGQFHALTPSAVQAITRLPHVKAVGGWITMPSLRLTAGGHSADVPALGQSPVTATATMLTRVARDDTSGVLVPDTTAHKLGLAPSALVGRQVTLTAGGDVCCSNSNGGIVVLGSDRHFSARIAGVYKSGSWSGPAIQGDSKAQPLLIAAPLAATIDGQLRNMSGPTFLRRQGYDSLIVVTDDARQTAAVASKIGAMNYQTYDRADLLARVHLVFSILTGGLGAIGGIALLVAAIGIANTMIMTILERTREIGIMKALGAEPGTVRRLFLVESALVGVIGGVAGLVLAELASLLANAVFHIWLKGQGVTDTVGNLSVISAELVIGSLVLALVVSLLAGALPSRRAVRLQPLDALRYE